MMVKEVSDVIHPYLTLPLCDGGVFRYYGFTVLYTSAVGF